MFKFSTNLEKESEAFSIIFQKCFRTEMEYISNGEIKVILFHPRTRKVKNYFILEVFWSWFLIHWKPDFLPRCMKEYTLSSIHNCPIRYNFCLLLLNKEDFYVIICPPWYSVSQASLVSWEYHYGLHLFPNTVDSTKTTTKTTNQLKNP